MGSFVWLLVFLGAESILGGVENGGDGEICILMSDKVEERVLSYEGARSEEGGQGAKTRIKHGYY